MNMTAASESAMKKVHERWDGRWYREDRVELIKSIYFITGAVAGSVLVFLWLSGF